MVETWLCWAASCWGAGTQNGGLCLQEILDSLAELYSLLQEEDMWAGLWQKRCKYSETATAIAYEQHGFFEQVATANGMAGCVLTRSPLILVLERSEVRVHI